MTQPNTHAEDGAGTITDRLKEPGTEAALHRILDRLDTIEQAVDSLASAVTHGPDAAAMVADIVDDSYRSAEEAGVDLDERLHLVLQLTERLTAPRTVEVLSRLTERLDTVDQAMTLADQAPGLLSMFVDMFDDTFRAVEEAGYDPERIAGLSAQALVEGTEFVDAGGFEALRESGILEPEAVTVVGQLADALVACKAECGDEPPEVGLLGLMKALRDPDTRRALGFLTTFGKQFGKQLRS